MKLDPQEQRNGTIWFVASGLVGLVVLTLLALIDVKLTYSDKEVKHAEVMNELRIAQSSIPTGSIDSREASGH